jgi:hypothetical protein
LRGFEPIDLTGPDPFRQIGQRVLGGILKLGVDQLGQVFGHTVHRCDDILHVRIAIEPDAAVVLEGFVILVRHA